MFSLQKEVIIMLYDGGARQHCSGNQIPVYKCIKSTGYTPETYTMLYVNYISVFKK